MECIGSTETILNPPPTERLDFTVNFEVKTDGTINVNATSSQGNANIECRFSYENDVNVPKLRKHMNKYLN